MDSADGIHFAIDGSTAIYHSAGAEQIYVVILEIGPEGCQITLQ